MRPLLLLGFLLLALAGCGDESGELHDQGARTTTAPAEECREIAGRSDEAAGTAGCRAVQVPATSGETP